VVTTFGNPSIIETWEKFQSKFKQKEEKKCEEKRDIETTKKQEQLTVAKG